MACKQIEARRKHYPNIGVKEPVERKIFGAAGGENTTHSKYEREIAQKDLWQNEEGATIPSAQKHQRQKSLAKFCIVLFFAAFH